MIHTLKPIWVARVAMTVYVCTCVHENMWSCECVHLHECICVTINVFMDICKPIITVNISFSLLLKSYTYSVHNHIFIQSPLRCIPIKDMMTTHWYHLPMHIHPKQKQSVCLFEQSYLGASPLSLYRRGLPSTVYVLPVPVCP